jgi:uncharacterized membrane protein
VILSLIGIIFSAYLTYYKIWLDSTPFCPVEGCNTVLESEYAVIFGIPVSVIGLLGFIAVFALALIRLMYPMDWNGIFLEFILLLALLGVGFGIYLTYLELFVIFAICVYCVVCFVLMILVLILVAVFYLALRKEPAAPAEGDDDAE